MGPVGLRPVPPGEEVLAQGPVQPQAAPLKTRANQTRMTSVMSGGRRRIRAASNGLDLAKGRLRRASSEHQTAARCASGTAEARIPRNHRNTIHSSTTRDDMNPEREVREIRDAQGRTLARAEYRDGFLDGVSRTWNKSGQLIEESEFHAGCRDGPYRTYWDNGQIKEEGMYRGGVRSGRYTWYSEDGGIIQEHDYGAPVDRPGGTAA